MHVVDSGVAARLLRLTPEKLVRLDPVAQTEFGHLLETFAVPPAPVYPPRTIIDLEETR